MSKGLAYTTFALLSSSLILMMVSMQVVNPYDAGSADADRIGEASFFLESMLSDLERTLEISTRRGITAVTNYVVVEGQPLEDGEAGVSEAAARGTLNGEELNGTENASLEEWTSRVADVASASGYQLEADLQNYSFDTEGLNVEGSLEVFTRLEDPVTLAEFNRSRSTDISVSVEDIEDTFLTLRSQGRYVSQYKQCGFENPGNIVYTGAQSSLGYNQGYAEVMPEDISEVEDRSGKVLVVENVDGYDSSAVDSYAGAVSAEESSNPGAYSTNYVFGTDSIQDIEQGVSLVLNEDQVWETYFREMFTEDCYVPVDGAPTFFDRLEDSLGNEGTDGLATLIDVSDLPSELRKQDSSVGYVYFDESGDYGGINQIKGVSNDYSWFYIDDRHVEYWGIEDLVE